MDSLLKIQRLAAGLTISQVARLTHISISKLSKVESGKLKLQVQDVLPLARALGCPATALLPRSPHEDATPAAD